MCKSVPSPSRECQRLPRTSLGLDLDRERLSSVDNEEPLRRRLVRGRALDLASLFDSEELELEDLASESESEESESESESDSESDEEDVDEELEAKVSAKANYEKWRPTVCAFSFFLPLLSVLL